MKTSAILPNEKLQTRPSNVQTFLLAYSHSIPHKEAPSETNTILEKISSTTTLKTKEYEPISQSRTSDVIFTKPVPIPAAPSANDPVNATPSNQMPASGRTSPPTRQPAPKKNHSLSGSMPPNSNAKRTNKAAQSVQTAAPANSRSNPVPIKPNASQTSRQRRPSVGSPPSPSPNEPRWAGPAYHKSPAPKQLPIPAFVDSPKAKTKLVFDQENIDQGAFTQKMLQTVVTPAQSAYSNEDLSRVSNHLKALLNIPVSS